MKKVMTLLLSAGLVLALLAGCSGTQPLPEGLDAATLEADAKQVVEQLNDRDWAALNSYFDDESLTEENWEESFGPLLDEMGAFEGYENVVTTGYTEPETEVEYGVVLLTCNYENDQRVYQVTFSTDGKVAGFHVPS